MDRERREFMLAHCRGMLDQMEEKYVRPAEDQIIVSLFRGAETGAFTVSVNR